MMRKHIACILLTLLIPTILIAAEKETGRLTFRRLSIHDGLSHPKVNTIMKDSKGFVWMGTQSGLNRFDGFRFKTFYRENNKPNTLPNSLIQSLTEDHEHNIWVNTASGYCIYCPTTEDFDTDTEEWMRQHGMSGRPDVVYNDKKGGLWIAVRGKGVYRLDTKTNRPHLFAQAKHGMNGLPDVAATDISQAGDAVVVSYEDGTLAKIDGEKKKTVWINPYMKQHKWRGFGRFKTFVDRNYNYWVMDRGYTMIYCTATRKWFDGVPAFLNAMGISSPARYITLDDLQEDNHGRIWMATDHNGLIVADMQKKTVSQYKNIKTDPTSIPDNTLQCLYREPNGAVWIGSYKSGAAYYSDEASRFTTIPLGDVCTMVEDREGQYWLGTNDNGIIRYNPRTGQTRHYGTAETGLGTDVVVSSTRDREGALWFGTFQGGLTRYKDGTFAAIKAGEPGSWLADNNIWALATDRKGRLIVGTLGAGVQIYDPETGKARTLNNANSGLASDYIASAELTARGDYLIGHSQNFSIVSAHNLKLRNVSGTSRGDNLSAPSVNHVTEDSRGLYWIATTAGIDIYDPETDMLTHLGTNDGMSASEACAIVEDNDRTMWIVKSNEVAHVKVSKSNGRWAFFTTGYNDTDGLQPGLYNYRSAMLTSDGKIVIGGRDGINIISSRDLIKKPINSRVIFSGLVLFDHPLNIGEEYDSHVVLDCALDECRTLRLSHSEKAFTILLASSNITVPEKSRFAYRLKGFDDQWRMTADGQPSVTFTNLSPGDYVLEVKVVDRDGMQNAAVSRLEISIAPPFYLSSAAIVLYLAVFCAIVFLLTRAQKRRAMARLRIERVEQEARRTRQIDEMKLRFFTNVSHEFRTPLTLILTPLTSLAARETDTEKKRTLDMILRNAERLETMVTQLLDFRKMDKEEESLNLTRGDIVALVCDICESYKTLGRSDITLTFFTMIPELVMMFDADKMRKIINNLLSNAYKFINGPGRVDLSMKTTSAGEGEEQRLEIRVADTGIGISDSDKQHVFDRFYQVKNSDTQQHGGTGVGLNLVKEFVSMMEGSISVLDNPGGGTVFIITLPVREAPDIQSEPLPAATTTDDRRRRILLVDDSEDFLQFMSGELETQYNVTTAANGAEALAKVKSLKPDLILSDVMMPGMDGNELCRRLKQDNDTAGIPFVMLSARIAEENKIEGMKSGADDYVTKPFSLDLLKLRIDRLIELYKSGKPTHLAPEVKTLEITSLDEKLMEKATRYVEEHLDDADMTVETMSVALGMSRVHLYKKLVSITGSTPSEFIRDIRLAYAEQLLRKSQMSVSEVAYKVGFNNPRYFSKYFKEKYGTMPSQYKTEHTGG